MFTVIIPYHNREKYVERTLQSIAASTQQPQKIILVDNASTDASAALCQQFKTSHPQLPLLLLEETRKGAAIARNTGLQAVETEWVYFFDSDDELSPDYFEHVLTQLHQNPQCDLIACTTQMVFEDGTTKLRAVQYSDNPCHQILSGQLATQGMFVRTSFLREIGGWNEHLTVWDDWELGLRVLLHHPRVCWIKDKAYHRLYQHGDSLTGENFSSAVAPITKAIESVCSQIQDNRKCRLALVSRCLFVAAQLHREKQDQQERQLLQLSKKVGGTYTTGLAKNYFRLLYFYLKRGGRGAWKITEIVLKWL